MLGKLKAIHGSSRSALFSVFRKAEVDRAVFFGVCTRISTAVTGPITALLIATRFSLELQGYYYTFSNLVALQIFVELGLGLVLIQFASHEWSRLRLDARGGIEGDPEAFSKLSSLARFALRWYVIGGGVAILGLGLGGWFFFSPSPVAGIDWASPWLLLCLLTGANICLTPVWSLLEGCNQVSSLYAFRFWQTTLTSLSIVFAIVAGGGLWAVPVSMGVTLVCSGFFIRNRWWTFFGSLFAAPPGGARLDWRTEILPMQWRMGLSSLSGFFIFALFTPVLFHYHGPRVAGQFGMTWSVVGLIGLIATSWVSPRVPQFGILIAQREYGRLDELFRRVTKISLAVSGILALFCWLAVVGLNVVAPRIAVRLLPPFPTALLVVAQVVSTASFPFSYYLRAHKREPLLKISVLAGVLTGLSTLLLGKHYAAIGAASGYLVVNLLILPLTVLTWRRRRLEWHCDAAAAGN